MTIFIRLIGEQNKEALLRQAVKLQGNHIFDLDTDNFKKIPGAPFAYWASENLRQIFSRMHPFQYGGRIAASGGKTLDDFRFIRAAWEIPPVISANWRCFAKGGSFSPYYADIYLVLDWHQNGESLKSYLVDYRASRGWSPNWTAELHSSEHYFRAGITWPRRTNGLSFRIMPRGSIFGDKGPAAFVPSDSEDELLFLSGILNTKAFALLVSLQLARTELAQSFEVGLVQNTPIPDCSILQKQELVQLVKRAWSLKRALDTIAETSHAFLLPSAIRSRLGEYDPATTAVELEAIQQKIDTIAFALFGISDADCATVLSSDGAIAASVSEDDIPGEVESNEEETEEEEGPTPVDQTDGLLSWASGVAFGRFDWRLVTGERAPPPEPDPFEPLPAKSPAMLPDGAAPFHTHSGILVDEPGHSHDFARLMEEVLVRVDVPVPPDVRRWLQREFFSLHLQGHSRSHRKAPIYWPLATSSGRYTLWLYYPDLTSQTLYTAINDFVEPKLAQVSRDAGVLRSRGTARSREDNRALEFLQSLEPELIELRDTLLQIVPTYHPNHDDGVQITAAPLWPMFRHKPWQKLLRETWDKLEKGEYDWSHLAMSYWPGRVREKCKTDKSFAIAHGLEALYEPPPASATGPGSRGRKRRGAAP